MLDMEIINAFELIEFSCIFPGEDVPSSPLDEVLELVSKCATIQDFFYFIFCFTLNNNRFWHMCDLAR
jgi:hypothetical protein